MFTLTISPVDPSSPVTLPQPWPALETNDFHADILLRVKGFMLTAQRLNFGEAAEEFLKYLGQGFLTRFDAGRFPIKPSDPDAALKRKALDALTELAQEFDGRISTIVWETLAYLATRPNPQGYESILNSQEHLPFPWYIADTVLHAIGKVFGLKHHIDTVFYRHTGFAFEHNCDCSCDLHPLDSEGKINSPLPTPKHLMATAALNSHLMSESLLIMALHMPFEMGVSPEAAEVMAIQVA